MNKCSHCGQEVAEHLETCPNCGADMNHQENTIVNHRESVQEKPESSTIGILAIVCGALGGGLGLILGIVGLCTYKNKENKRNCIIGMCLSVVWIVFIVILYAAIIAAALHQVIAVAS